MSGANPKHTRIPHCTSDANRAPSLSFMPDNAWLKQAVGSQGHTNLLALYSPISCYTGRFTLSKDPHAFKQAGYSTVGTTSDCRLQQQSDGPWFDSGWLEHYFEEVPAWGSEQSERNCQLTCLSIYRSLAPARISATCIVPCDECPTLSNI